MPGVTDYIEEHRALEKAVGLLNLWAGRAVLSLLDLEAALVTRLPNGSQYCQHCRASGTTATFKHKRTCPLAVLDRMRQAREPLVRELLHHEQPKLVMNTITNSGGECDQPQTDGEGPILGSGMVPGDGLHETQPRLFALLVGAGSLDPQAQS
jgi:hypothetical protein